MAENFAVENGVLTFGFSATKSLTTEIVSILSQKKKNSTLHWIKWPKKTFGLSCILLVKGRRKRLAFAKVSVTIVQSSPPVRYFEPPQYDWLLLRLISNQGVDSHPGDLLTKILRNKKHLMRILSRNLSAWKSVSAEPRPEQQFCTHYCTVCWHEDLRKLPLTNELFSFSTCLLILMNEWIFVLNYCWKFCNIQKSSPGRLSEH